MARQWAPREGQRDVASQGHAPAGPAPLRPRRQVPLFDARLR